MATLLVPTVMIALVVWVNFGSNSSSVVDENTISVIFISVMLVSFFVLGVNLLFVMIKFVKAALLMPKFIRANGWLVWGGPAETKFAGQIFQQSQDGLFKPVVKIPENNLFSGQGQIELGNYAFSQANIAYNYGFVRIKLQRPLPHILIDGLQNNLFSFLSNLPIEQRRDQLFKTSIGFDKHFNTYVPKDYERDALEILTPDLMSDLIEYGAGYDFEIIDDEFYIFSSSEFDLLKQEQYEKIFKLVLVVVEKVDAKSGRYRDHRVTDGYGRVAPAGRRLSERKGFNL